MVKRLKNDIKTEIIPILRNYEAEYVTDAYATLLELAFERIRATYSNIDKQAKSLSNSFVSQVDKDNRKKFISSINQSMGVDLEQILQNEGLDDTIVAATRQNVSLIKSIPDQFLKDIETAVFQGATQGSTAGGLIKEIQRIGRVTENRAKLIARDQTAKINLAITKTRQTNLGIEEYIWVTARDGDRVRQAHRNNDGKTFRWDSPPPTGHPGEDINCRCVAQPVIKL